MFQLLISSGSYSLYCMMYYELQPAYLCDFESGSTGLYVMSDEKDAFTGANWVKCETIDFCGKEGV